MTAAVVQPNQGPQDLTGDMIRRIDAALGGGASGPIVKLASFTSRAYGAADDGPAYVDNAYACDATSGAITCTAPIAANTPLGTKIKLSKTDASGNAVTFSAPDAFIGRPADATTSLANTVANTSKLFTLANFGTAAAPSFGWVVG